MSALSDSLERRVAALEQMVAALPGSEALQPNYLTVDPTGKVGANFSGKITASELDLIGGAGASPIKWVTAGGGLLAELTVDASGNLSLSPAGLFKGQGFAMPEAGGSAFTPSKAVQWQDGGGNAQSFVQGYSSGGGHALIMEQIAQTLFLLLAGGTVSVGAGSQAVTLLDNTGYSGLVFNAAGVGTPLAVNAGTSSMFFSASQNASVTINHGLPRPPRAVLGTLLAVGALSFSAILSATNVGFGTFDMTGFVTQGNITGSVGFSWLAIG